MQPKKRPTQAIIDNWKRQVLLQEKLGKTVLEFIRHPDATTEQVLEVQSRYRETHRKHIEMRDNLRKIWPSSYQYWGPYPWENQT